MAFIEKKSLLFGLLIVFVLAAIAFAASLVRPTSEDPVAVVQTYYRTNKTFDSEGADRDQLKSLIAPSVWQCIEDGVLEAKENASEANSTTVLLSNCGLHEVGFYQDPYPFAQADFDVVMETPEVADVEVTFEAAPQVSLRYLLTQSEGSWHIVRADSFGYAGAPQYVFPEEEEAVVKTIPGVSWQWMPADQYWYPHSQGVDARALEGTSLFGRSTTNKFTDSFAEFDPALVELGWQQEVEVAADGVGSSILGYQRTVGDRLQHLIFEYQTIFLGLSASDKPPSCPCIYTNKVFFSDEPVQ